VRHARREVAEQMYALVNDAVQKIFLILDKLRMHRSKWVKT
jgi:hypothetical protein